MREHCADNVEYNLSFRAIGSCHFNENVFGGEADLGVVAIDNGRKGEDHIVTVKNHGIHRRVSDQWQKTFKVKITLWVLRKI